MRGWRLVGRLVRRHGELDLHLSSIGGPVPAAGDIIGVSPFAEGPLRPGIASVPRTPGKAPDWRGITAACDGDYVFVATAIGEDAFRPAEAT